MLKRKAWTNGKLWEYMEITGRSIEVWEPKEYILTREGI